jgi:subtilisin family serine protease
MAMLDALAAAVLPRSSREGMAQARFALVLRPDQDPLAVAAGLDSVLGGSEARVAPLSALDRRTLVVDLPDKTFSDDDAAVFTAVHALRDMLGVHVVEADLPTVFPEDEGDAEPRDLDDLSGRSSGGALPGCQAPAEPALADDWALKALRIPEAWAYSESLQRPSRGNGVVVAQPDTGTTAHTELSGVSTISGRDIIDDDADPTDPMDYPGHPGHGTGTASVVFSSPAGRISGAAPAAQLMPIRAVRSVVQVTPLSVAQALDWATEHKADVITLSLGGLPSETLLRALRRAVAADVIVLAAAGNCVRLVVFPARYEECIAVAGSNAADAPWRGTCRGSAVDVAAPAQNVLRAEPDHASVGHGQGTSFAVALTAGVAALWLAHHGRAKVVDAAHANGETVQQMFARLLKSTTRRPTVWDASTFGTGIVDARALLGADLESPRSMRQASVSPAAPDAGPAASLRSLVHDAVGSQAFDDDLDWRQHGPEVALALMPALRRRPVPHRRRVHTVGRSVTAPSVSPQLATAVRNADLRAALGLRPSASNDSMRRRPSRDPVSGVLS